MVKIKAIAVSNSSPLIYLAKIGRLNLIKEVYGKIWIPEAVFDEAVTKAKTLHILNASLIEKAVGQWITKESVRPEISSEYGFLDLNEKLGLGEKEALKLCKQLNVGFFIVDDKEARSIARILKIKPIGTCGMLIQANRLGVISAEEAEEILDELIKNRFRIEPAVYRRIREELKSITPKP